MRSLRQRRGVSGGRAAAAGVAPCSNAVVLSVLPLVVVDMSVSFVHAYTDPRTLPPPDGISLRGTLGGCGAVVLMARWLIARREIGGSAGVLVALVRGELG